MIDQGIFDSLQAHIDQDSQVRESLRAIVQDLERHVRSSQSALSQAHSLPESRIRELLSASTQAIGKVKSTVGVLNLEASKYPYHKYNQMWSREIQSAIFVMIFHHWLADDYYLMPIEKVGRTYNVPVNSTDPTTFHITTEEYLHALISLTEELARLAVNSVTLGDYQRPLIISKFVKDLHAGFQILNLKNDSLRKRSDGIKYNVKKIEDVVYDLSLRNLLPSAGATS